ncbi:hypothetical protein C4K04_4388 [Pseudomonas chlororaphis]|uniref:Uncharacterized protein n=1 Tax=Pseudomonas chlororaphis TaxID=587753 RepID=A0A3G7TSF4_9PSED|nr:hypothetical protein C4K04_4388 [Pseudomonas chlororaphis]
MFLVRGRLLGREIGGAVGQGEQAAGGFCRSRGAPSSCPR